MREKDLQRLKTNYYSKKEVENLKKYGYALVMNLYSPHITLGIAEGKDRNIFIKSSDKKIAKIKNKSYLVKDFTVGFFGEENLDEPIMEKRIKLK